MKKAIVTISVLSLVVILVVPVFAGVVADSGGQGWSGEPGPWDAPLAAVPPIHRC